MRAANPHEEAVLLEHEELVSREAHLAHRRYPWARLEDLLQEGRVGLIKASRSTSRDASKPFEAYARTSIRNEIRNSAEATRNADRVLLGRVMAAENALLAEGARYPTEVEVADEANRQAAARKRKKANPPKELTAHDVERARDMLRIADADAMDDLARSGFEIGDPHIARFAQLPARWHERYLATLAELLKAAKIPEKQAFALACHVFGMSDEAISKAGDLALASVRVRRSEGFAVVEQALDSKLQAAGIPAEARACISVLLFPRGRDGWDDDHLQLVGRCEELLNGAKMTLEREAATVRIDHWLVELVDVLLTFVRKVTFA